MSIGMIATSTVDSAGSLALCRFVTGLGIGAMVATAGTLAIEYSAARWRTVSVAAVVIGFFGVLLVIRPGGEGGVHWAALVCVAMAVFNAIFHLLTRVLSRTDSAEVAVVYSGFTGAAVFSCLVPFVWIAPDPGEWALLAAIGLMGAAGHYCLSRAYVYARASVLAPYTYLQIMWAAGFGYAVFADVPPPATIAGSGIVVAAGLYIFYRERVTKGV
jgi:drug/metabolite transporter (DMT)-like permease